MNFFDSYWSAAESITSKSGRREFIAAVVEYYYTGELPRLKNAQARVAFAAVKFSLDRAIRGRAARNENAPARRRGAERRGDRAQVEKREKKDGERLTRRGNRKSPAPNPQASRRCDFRVVKKPSGASGLSPHASACLDAVNAALGTAYKTMSPSMAGVLDETADAFSPADIGGMAALARQMSKDAGDTDPIALEALFEPRKFYDWMEIALVAGCIDDGCGRGDALFR